MIVGLCGPEGAGKTTAARIICAQRPKTVVHSFAAPLKKMIEALGVDRKHLYGTPAEKAEPVALLGGKTARRAMQTLGTEWGRQLIAPELWVNAWAVLPDSAPSMHYVADDVRFPNEVEAIKSRGGVILKIIREEGDMLREPKHASEDFRKLPHDALIVNDKCPTILGQRLAEAFKKIADARKLDAMFREACLSG